MWGKHSVRGDLRPGLSSLWAWHELEQNPPGPESHPLSAACVQLLFSRLPLEAAAPLTRLALLGPSCHLSDPRGVHGTQLSVSCLATPEVCIVCLP